MKRENIKQTKEKRWCLVCRERRKKRERDRAMARRERRKKKLIQTYGNNVYYVSLFVYLHNYRQANIGQFEEKLCKFYIFFLL